MSAAGTAAGVGVERIGDGKQLAIEFLMNALRLPDGVPLSTFEERTGVSVAAIEKDVQAARKRGWLAAEDHVLRPTPAGLEMLNPLLALFC